MSREITCPYCEFEFQNSHEEHLSAVCGETICPKCNKEFYYEVEYYPDYSSFKKRG